MDVINIVGAVFTLCVACILFWEKGLVFAWTGIVLIGASYLCILIAPPIKSQDPQITAFLAAYFALAGSVGANLFCNGITMFKAEQRAKESEKTRRAWSDSGEV